MDSNYHRAYQYVSTGGVSLPGPGNGISYTPLSAPEPIFYIGLGKVTPETATPGKKFPEKFLKIRPKSQHFSCHQVCFYCAYWIEYSIPCLE
jgi:hypothetical protein